MATTWTGGTSSDWSTAANWDNGVPNGTENVTINNVSDGTLHAPVLTTAYTLDPDGGGGDMFIGNGGGEGVLDINDGGSLDGSGNWTLVGNGAGSAGTLNVNSGGSFVGDNNIRLGRGGGTGTLNVNGGSVGGSGLDEGGGTGIVKVTNDGIIDVSGNIRMNGSGNSSIDSGSISTGGQLLIGVAGEGGTHTLDVTGGTISSNSWFVVGHVSGNAVMNVSGDETVINKVGAGSFFTIGANGGADGTVNQNGGTITDGTAGTGNYGTFLGENADSIGTYNLNGGDFHTSRIRVGGGTAQLNLNGGTLHATQNDETFIGTGVNVDIQAGGAFIDSEGFDVTMNVPLSGVGNLTKSGAGQLYIVGDGDGGVTFTGDIIVSEGGIGLGGDFSNESIIIPANGSIGVTDEDPTFDALGTLSLASLTFGDNTSVVLDIAETDMADKITATALTAGSSVTVNLVPDDTAFYGSKATIEGTYTIFEYTGSFSGDLSNFSIGNSEVGFVYNFADTGSAITVEVILNDSDNDGLPDDYEIANFGDLSQGYDDNFDNDFASNGEEFIAGTNPTDSSDDPFDVDDDGMLDADENLYFGSLDYSDGTGDTDGDCELDVDEVNEFQDPTSASVFTDTDFDGLPDAYEIAHFGDLSQDDSGDFDTDNFSNLEEYQHGSDPSTGLWSPAFPLPAHRWSFNGDLTDSVGGVTATIQAGDTTSTNTAAVGANQVVMVGGAKADSEWIQLGSNLLPEKNTAVTLQTWATNNAIQNWARIFSFHDDSGTTDAESLFMAWTRGTDNATNQSSWYNDVNDPDSNGADASAPDIHGTFTLGTEYHVAVTICPDPEDPDFSVVTFYSAEASSLDLGAAKGGFTINARISSLNDLVAALGRSRWADNTASASYNEFRIYDGCLLPWALESLHDLGPDAASISMTDSDSDGLPDQFEQFYFGNLAENLLDDSDDDSVSNRDELLVGTDPNDGASTPNDSDADGLLDDDELFYFGDLTTSDGTGDFDGDFESDADELGGTFTDPTDPTDATDSDTDEMGDAWEINFFGDLSRDGLGDFDEDNSSDVDEFFGLTNPANPLEPVVKFDDRDGDGLPDTWEINILGASLLSEFGANDDPDGDFDSNLAEYQATSDPRDINSTASDVNGDGTTDSVTFLGMDATGSGILDFEGEATPFTRLDGSGTALAAQDANLDLDIANSTLAITSSPADINGQLGMDVLEAFGLELSSLGFTGAEDFRIRAHYACLPATASFDQIGAYVGTSTTALTRSSSIQGSFQSLGVNTNGTNDADAFFGTAGEAGVFDGNLTVIIERIGGVWSATTNGNAATPIAQPVFLDGTADLNAGVFSLHDGAGSGPGTVELDDFTVVIFGSASPATLEIVSSGFNNFGDFEIQLAGDATGATVEQSTNLTNWAAVAATISGSTITIASANLDPDGNGDSFFRVTQ
ncbi:hypothetical protein GCM10007100_38370 [Roseibacillus persicicus]|uniref:Uncharacterized protein n=2 Tax=Roseibacillus persicicus TaxID=454148 RepID=A0A918TYN0_9BACT|nr:hypothetical protein GCM10007100_38370 [Roseibacillus persicicus]